MTILSGVADGSTVVGILIRFYVITVDWLSNAAFSYDKSLTRTGRTFSPGTCSLNEARHTGLAQPVFVILCRIYY